MRETLKAWYQASRPPFYIATAAPLLLGFILASQDIGQWRIGRFILINLGAFLVHLATNLADDLFDYILGADAGESIGGSRVVHEGKITLTQLAWALVILYSIAFLIAGYVIRTSGQHGVWLLVAFAAISSVFYVAPPIKYGYRGLGELSVFINMGLIMVGGTYWVTAETWRWDVLWYACPIGLMVANILFFQSLPDMTTDRNVGKMTLAVKLGRQGSAAAFRIWWALTYAFCLGLYAYDMAGWTIWLVLITLPLFRRTNYLIHTVEDWVDLDKYGHMIRKLYLINSVILIVSVIQKG